MSILAAALGYERLVESNATLRMLRSANVPVAAAILRSHLGTSGSRLLADDLYELMDPDLEVLRDHFDLPKTAKAYCDDWRTAGYLIRRPASHVRGETYELSFDALTGIRILEQLDAPQSTITESRLVNLAASVRQLAIDTDPDAARRLAALQDERARIDAEITALQGGQLSVLDDRRALERVTDVLLQAQDLPADFARVRARFEQLNFDLRESIVNAEETQSSVLDDVFRGVDLIESSDEGRTFTAFLALIRDPLQASTLDGDIGEVLQRDFTKDLTPAQRRVLRTLLRELKAGSREVNGVLTEFARGLRRYVQSQEYQRDRALRGALQQGLGAAVGASKLVRPTYDLDMELNLSPAQMGSAGSVTLFDPAEFDTGAALKDDVPGTVDFATLAAIARESEIDFAELTMNVNAVVTATVRPSVAQILAQFPATQGLASIVGLLSLARQQGEVQDGAFETLTWHGLDNVSRSALVMTHIFTRKVR